MQRLPIPKLLPALLLRLAAGGPWLAALLATTFAIFFLALLPATARINESADYTEFYRPVAHSLLSGDGLRIDGQVAARYPPLFPLALATAIGSGRLVGLPEELSVGLLALLGFAATAGALCRLGILVHGPLAGFLAAMAFCLYPPHLFLVKQPNSELLFLPLLIFACELLWRSRTQISRAALLVLAAGGVVGLAALVRPIAVALAAPLALFLLFCPTANSRPRRFVLALLLCAGQALVMAPWLLHLRFELGTFVPLSTGGRLSMLDGLTLATKKDRPPPPMPEEVAALMREVDAARPRLRSASAILAFLGDKAREEPTTVGLLLALKTARSFYATDSMRFEPQLLALQLPLLLLFAFTLRRAFRRPEEPWRALAVLALLILLYFLAMTVLVLSILRYLVPALAPLFLLLGAFAAEFMAPRPSSPKDPS